MTDGELLLDLQANQARTGGGQCVTLPCVPLLRDVVAFMPFRFNVNEYKATRDKRYRDIIIYDGKSEQYRFYQAMLG